MRTALLFFFTLWLHARVAHGQATRTVFLEGAAGPGVVLSGEPRTVLGVAGSLGFRAKSFALEVSLGDLLFREARTTTANFTFTEAAARVFIPTTGKAELFGRASLGVGAFADVVTSQASTVLTSSFGLGLQYHLTPNRYLGLLVKAQAVQLTSQSLESLASGELGLRVGFVF
jgi:hypothetical protein